MDMVMLLLMMLLLSGNGNNNDNRDDDRDRDGDRDRDRDRRGRFRDRGRFFFDDDFTTPYRSAKRSLCNLETLAFILLFFYVNEINAPVAAVPVPLADGVNPFFERFDRFEGEEEFEFEN